MLRYHMHAKRVHYPLLVVTVLVTALMLWAAIARIRVDTDVVSSLPDDHGILADAVYIFKNHPIQNQIAIDIALDRVDQDFLVVVAGEVEQRLRASGLFTKVGMDDMQQVIPRLIAHVVDDLPFLFSAEQLETQIESLISQDAVESRLQQLHRSLLDFNSIGQAGLIARDPLGLRDLKLVALSALAPSPNAQIYKGKLLSSDGRHLMILAHPTGSGTDTAFARKLTDLIEHARVAVNQLYPDAKDRIVLTPVGAYRASLDNETMVRQDVNKAIILATLGIAVLLLAAFPRPLIGLLALVPALVGTTVAFFIFSLIRESVSVLALGFGGAIISITVDHGIAYLLFLDRPVESFGREASREVWAVGLLAMLTTVGAFIVLSFSGFLIFEQLGLFTAMGIACSFLFVHTVFPRIFPSLPPAPASHSLPLMRWADSLAGLGVKGGLFALVLGIGLLFWAKPQFNVDLSAMNSISESTRQAESLFASVWGNIFSKIYVMTEAQTIGTLQKKADQVLAEIERARKNQEIEATFVSSELFPGAIRRQANIAAWRHFWSARKVAALRATMGTAALENGFNAQAFEPFFQSLSSSNQGYEKPPSELSIDKRYHELLGISQSAHDGTWRQIIGMTAGPSYDGEDLYSKFSDLGKVFDARLFSDKMGQLLFTTFSRMLLIIGISVIVLLFLFFADWRLTVICLLPLVFAFVCTLGTLTLLGRSLDIPALMLAIIVLGMGIDYTLFFVRAYQRYQTRIHPSFSLIRMSVLMASVSTLIGFGVLATAQHTLLRSAGVTSFLGIGYSMLGAFLILPPLLDRRFTRKTDRAIKCLNKADGNACVMARYRNLEPYPRFFARFKLRLDPMFQELDGILPPPGASLLTIIDIGTGYAVPACWLQQRYPCAHIYGIEPDPDRVRVANLVLEGNGKVVQGLAPQVPKAPEAADAAFMLDMCHFLDDSAFELTLERLYATMKIDGLFLVRVVLKPQRRLPWTWWMENLKMKFNAAPAFYRSLDTVSELIRRNGFEILETNFSGKHKELAWVVSRR
jgi:predicted exporter